MPCCKAEEYIWCKDLTIVSYMDTEGNEYCVFHAPKGQKGISLEEFNKLVFERIDSAKKESEHSDLGGTIFEGYISFNEFNKDNPLYDISFCKATFSDEAHFRETTFSKRADFRGATFSDGAHFGGATFSKGAHFWRTTFSKGAFFGVATFSDEADFGRATFSDEAFFGKTTFSKGADFGRATFSKRADFMGATFSDEADFRRATFSDEAFFGGKTFFNKVYLDNLKIENKIKFEGVNLSKSSFQDSDLYLIDFINPIWPKKYGRNVLFDEIKLFFNITDDKGKDLQDVEKIPEGSFDKFKQQYKQIFNSLKRRFEGNLFEIFKREWNGFKKDISFEKEIVHKVEILYCTLKRKYKEEHNEPEVSNWHYGEKEMFRKGNLFRRYFPISLSNLYWLSSGYGERPLRAGMFLFSLILILSFFLFKAGLNNLNSNYEINTWSIVLNTLKFATFQKDFFFVPKNLYGETFKLLAQILIPIQTALFALAVRNRFRR